jgi:molybdopterin/thiamine biosynthesis adenylyltransferase
MEIDVEDEAVKDRWSRYIGAMGKEAVEKQSKAHVFLSGAGALGIEIAKNIVLAGCKSFVLHDDQPISKRDLSGQFFINAEDKQTTRGAACHNRLQSLNFYVKVTHTGTGPVPKDPAMYEQEPWNFHQKDVIVLTERELIV